MADNVKTGVYTKNEDEFKLDIKTSLSAGEKALFVKVATNLLFDEDGNYYSILKDMMFEFALAVMFTNLDTDYIFESDDVYEEVEELIGSSNIADIVIANAEIGLIDSLRKSVDENIEYRTGIRKNTVSESLSNLLNTLDEKVSNFNFNLNDDNVADILSAMTNISSEVNMEKILEAYSKTDMFKNKWEQLVEEKNTTALSPTV